MALRFLQLSSELSTLRWSSHDYILMDQLLDIKRVDAGSSAGRATLPRAAERDPSLRVTDRHGQQREGGCLKKN